MNLKEIIPLKNNSMSGDNNKYTPEEMYSKEELESRLAFMKDTAPIREQIKKISDGEHSSWFVGYYSHFKDGNHFCFIHSKKSTETNDSVPWEIVTTENPLRD